MKSEIRPRLYVPFECSGRVRSAYAARGWFAVSCDLKPTALPCGPNEYHHIGDARDLIDPEWLFGVGWDMMIAFPVCTRMANSGSLRLYRGGKKANGRDPAKWADLAEATAMFNTFLDADIPRIAVENPIMHRWARERISRPYDQIIQPNQFGEDASKATCIWLKRLPPLKGTKDFPPRYVDGRPRWGNQTDGGFNKLPPSPERAAMRAETYPGVAEAMADQWGCLREADETWHQPLLNFQSEAR